MSFKGEMSRIKATFEKLQTEGKKAFIAYICAGDPDFKRCLEIMLSLSRAGADVIELGVPFSDPLADGIVNQLASERALKAGMTLPRVLELIKAFREQDTTTPLVLFTYLNPIYAYGYKQLHQDAQVAGADGILVLDLPYDEALLNPELDKAKGLDHIYLISPNTPEPRIKLLAEKSEGFIYALSRAGVTGAHGTPSEQIGEQVRNIKSHTNTPVCVGFGINTPEQAQAVASCADGIIVGSAIVRQIQENSSSELLPKQVQDFTSPLIQAAKKAI